MSTVAEQLELFTLARSLAHVAHRGQTRKGGAPYISHVTRVSYNAGRLGRKAATVAYLHDVVEDTLVNQETIDELFPLDIAIDVDTLTRDTAGGETYTEFINRIVKFGSETALQVKLADLHDNMSDPAKQVPSRLRRYHKADVKIRAELVRRGIKPIIFT